MNIVDFTGAPMMRSKLYTGLAGASRHAFDTSRLAYFCFFEGAKVRRKYYNMNRSEVLYEHDGDLPALLSVLYLDSGIYNVATLQRSTRPGLLFEYSTFDFKHRPGYRATSHDQGWDLYCNPTFDLWIRHQHECDKVTHFYARGHWTEKSPQNCRHSHISSRCECEEPNPNRDGKCIKCGSMHFDMPKEEFESRLRNLGQVCLCCVEEYDCTCVCGCVCCTNRCKSCPCECEGIDLLKAFAERSEPKTQESWLGVSEKNFMSVTDPEIRGIFISRYRPLIRTVEGALEHGFAKDVGGENVLLGFYREVDGLIEVMLDKENGIRFSPEDLQDG